VFVLKITQDGRDLGELSPAMNHYKRMGQPIGTPAVRSGLKDDLYLSLIQVNAASKTVSLDVIIEPMVWWIWFGAGVMVLGTLVAGWPEAARCPAPSTAAPVRSAQAPPVMQRGRRRASGEARCGMSCSQRYHDATSMASLPSAHCIFQLCGVAFIALGVSAENVKSRHL